MGVPPAHLRAQARVLPRCGRLSQEERRLCVESSDTSAAGTRWRSCSTGSGGSSTAAMTPQGSPSRPRQASRCGEAPAASTGLDRLVALEPLSGIVGLGHTRWATHGRPADHNAHPHRGLQRAPCRRPQRHPRELPRAEVRARGGRSPLHVGDRHRGGRPSHRSVPDAGNRRSAAAVTAALQRIRGAFAICVLSAADAGAASSWPSAARAPW